MTVLMVLAPLLVVILSWSSDQTTIWQHLIATQLPTLLRNTLVLIIGVGMGVTVLGTGLAWLVVMYQFPGRRWLDWALMLPIAVPAYVLAFVVLGLLDFTGPIQQSLSALLGDKYSFIDIRHESTVIVVLVLTFYPYVYMLARSAFLAQSSDMMEAAQILGTSLKGAFFRVALPMARPAIVAGTALAIMETLADFGTVSAFNYDTFTTAIYKAWFGFFNLQAAAQLASLLLLCVALVLFAEKFSRGSKHYTQRSGRLQHRFRYTLAAPKAWCLTGMCLCVLFAGFIAPVIQLSYWAIQQGVIAIDQRYFSLLWHSLSLGLLGALITVMLALLIALNRRQASRRWHMFFDIATLGYALPGSVLAVGIVLSFVAIENYILNPLAASLLGFAPRQWLMGSLLTLLAAYWIRFLAVANGPVESSLQRIHHTIPEAARSLGAHGWKVLWQIYLPMLRPGIITASILVFVDIIKEMPATLLLRPFGWDTLAVRIYEMTSEGEWQQAALPALAIILLSLIPVTQAMKYSIKR